MQPGAIFEMVRLFAPTSQQDKTSRTLFSHHHWCSIRMMRSGARIAIGVASVLAAVVNFTGCGSSSNDSMVNGSAAAAGAGATAAASAGGALNLNTGGSENGNTIG